MPLWRYHPPVHGALPAGAIAAALAARSSHGAEAARARATAALVARYPGRVIHLVDSGTGALTLALARSRRSRDRPVVALPAYACPDVGTAALGAGYAIRLYDTDPDTLQPDPASVGQALTEGATHVVCTHLFGRLVDVASLASLVTSHGAVLIEDAAQHAGGTLRGVRGGALASLSILSFGRGKGLNAGGGGALLMPHGVMDEGPSVMAPPPSGSRILCAAVLADQLSSPWLYRLPARVPALGIGETRYHAPRPVAAMSGVSAALLTLALEAEPAALAGRRAAEAAYHEALSEQPGVLCARHPEGESGALRCPVRLDTAVAAPLAAFGVVRSYPRTLAAYPEIAAVVTGRRDWPGARALAARLHTLPTHARLGAAERVALLARLTG
jgi:perosamine synthetase